MFPILYDETSITYGTVPSDNGLGVLSDALACKVTEERNGVYELELTYPASGIHSKDIQLRHLLKVKPNFTDNNQLFRIYKIGKVLNGSFKINARHISYDLSGIEITSGSAGSAVAACTLLSTNDFTIDTDKNVVANFKITEPSSRRSWLGGKAGSLLDVFGTGEYHFDNFDIHFLLHRGTNRGVEVRYGKNLLSLSQDRDSSSLTTAIIVFWKDSETGEVVYSAKTSTGLTLDVENVQCIDVSMDYDEKPTVAQLNLKAQNYIQNHDYSVVKNNVKLNFLQIGTLKDRVDLCDEVKIIYEDFGIESTAKCVKTVWNVLDEKYESIELGELKANFADTFISTTNETRQIINQSQTMLQIAIQNATSLITGNDGGYVILHDSNNDGYPDEILIMDTADIATATKVWRWNKSGLGYSSTGYAGTYGLAMTMDGQIVASFITTGTMSANRVRTGLLQDVSGNNYFDLDSGRAHFDSLEISIGGTDTDAATAISNAATAAANAQTTADGKVSPSAVRTAFAADSTSITVSSGTITFNSNSFIVNSDYFKVNRYGGVQASQIAYNGFIYFYANSSFTGNSCMQIGATVIIPSGGSASIEPAIYMYDTSSNLERIMMYATPSGLAYGAVLKMSGDGTSNYSQLTDYDLDFRRGGKSLAHMYDNGGEGIIFLEKSSGWSYRTMINSAGIYGTPSSGSYPFALEATSQNGGHFYLGTTSGSPKIQMYGASGYVECVTLVQTSTRKTKKNIVDLDEAEARKILELRPSVYDFKDEAMGKDRRGFIAEDVYDVIPQVVGKNEAGEINSLDYIQLIPYLTKLIQMQQKDIEWLKKKMKEA